ncbi:MAG: NAAT family transporter [candidate division Zixibacteria bacterium]|nr:NAAT family transporter [candidate division Zixibacteria bacterium]
MLEFAFSSIAALFVILDPLGAVPIFLGATEGYTTDRRKQIIFRACWVSLLILVLFAVLGRLLLDLFGITLPAFRIAGGLLLLKISLDMLYAKRPDSHITDSEEAEALEKEDIAVVPLAMPMLAGPATIATVLVLMEQADDIIKSGIVIGSIIISITATFLILRSSTFFYNLLGESGVKITIRVMGLILLALSIQFISNGIKQLFLIG